jgi:ubiquinone/menaquinone biosynthesis C-methylase UbiE
MKVKKNYYDGWELKLFDNSNHYRNYQFDLIKNKINGHLAEVGPGNGKNIYCYFKKCKTIDLFEPSYNLFNVLKNRFSNNKKINLKKKEFTKINNKYDCILYMDVIEHIKNDKKEIKKAYGSLKKNGRLIVNVPAFQHLYSKFDKDVGHFRRYNKNQILSLCKSLKINNIDMKYYDSIGYLLSFFSKLIVSDYKKDFEKKIKLWNSLIFLSRIIDFLTMHLFGKSLMVIITKK